jgi:Bacterial regulatory helix-turn-helix protein, lysR family
LTTESHNPTDPAEPIEAITPAGQIRRDIQAATTMDLNVLRAFVHLADIGSLPEVAFSVGWTRAALAHQMTLLEDRLGGRILTNGSKGTELTPRGARFLPYVRVLLEVVEVLRSPPVPDDPPPATDQ